MLRDVQLQHILGAIKAQGLLDRKIQSILQHHCDAGRIAEVAEVVATALYHQALVDRTMPEPQGIKTKELEARATSAAQRLAEDYARRGVLVAKGYLPAGQLALGILRIWETQFSSVLQNPEEPHELVDDLDPDFITRSSVSAQAILALLARLPKSADGEALLLPMKEVEGFCVSATRAMYKAFVKPDHAVHETLHGEVPKEDR